MARDAAVAVAKKPTAPRQVAKKELEAYLAEAQAWEVSALLKSERSKKQAWMVAGCMGVVAVFASVAGALLATRQPDPPVVLRVDNSTGIVDLVRRQTDPKTTYDEIMATYFLRQYIRVREGYSRELADEFYKTVGLMSIGAEQKRYYEFFNPKNPLSPLNVYGNTAKVRVDIKSFTFLKPTQALVRWSSTVERAGDKPIVAHWASMVVFRYSSAPMKDKDRETNPLGFQVTEYRRDADSSVGDTTPAAPQQAQPLATAAPAQGNGVVLFPGQPPAQPQPIVPAVQQ
ncbi:virB8 family protein (plasmid) [Sphaerotilaceae bacterium SBD11-9]